MIDDPFFYAVAIPAIILTGLAKGGFLAGLGGLAVPIMALAISPIQAAGIMLPILIAMDMVGTTAYRREFDTENLKIMLPAAMVGIGVGWATAAWVTEAHVRLIVGVVALLFSMKYWLDWRAEAQQPTGRNLRKGSFWGLISGFTSFVSHTGAPPFQIYMLPQKLPNAVFAATAIVFFTTVNLVKVIPYWALGQFSSGNLLTTAVLLPLAPVSILIGIWLTRRVPQEPFYRITYACLLIISLKLIWDGWHGI
ncbi:MAG: sulfite exporter TauE/SafE family protein [Pseudomonadota bacterium]